MRRLEDAIAVSGRLREDRAAGLWKRVHTYVLGAGWGRQRVRLRSEACAKMGKEGEDIVATNTSDGLSLRMPARYHPASVKGAAWQVCNFWV